MCSVLKTSSNSKTEYGYGGSVVDNWLQSSLTVRVIASTSIQRDITALFTHLVCDTIPIFPSVRRNGYTKRPQETGNIVNNVPGYCMTTQ